MSKSNSRASNFAEGIVTSITKDDATKTLTIVFNSEVSNDSNVIFKNSALLINAFSSGNIINGKSLNFKNSSNVTQSYVNLKLKIESSHFQNVNNVKHLFVTCKWKPENYSTIANSFSFSSSLSNKLLYSKIGAPKAEGNSGILTSALKNILNLKSFVMGSLPSSKITTGKILQSFNDPYVEKNLIEFKQKNNVNVSLGVPLKETQEDNGFFITTNDSLLNSGSPLQLNSSQYLKKYDLKNTKIKGSEFSFGEQIKVTKNITKDNLDSLILKNNFEEEFIPYKENDYYFEEEATRSTFYSDTIDKDFKNGYNLGKQKQIKITLDFPGGNNNDLHLLNTKFSFIYPNESIVPSNFTQSSNRDNVYDTKYFNFLKGSKAESYSSHHMPTAYWNASQNRWSYLDAGTDDVNYLGCKIPSSNTENQIQKNFIFDSSNNLETELINTNHYRNFNALYYNKPIMTTPGFRNDGSFLESNTSNNYNKSMLCQITDSYGFPYKTNWQPTNDHLIDMSKYLAKDFLLEKMIIRGEYTSKGEMPIKKGNFFDGYTQSGNAISSFSDFNNTYEMKDDSTEYISNAVTFFLLNEQENKNYFDQKIKIEPIQHYSHLKTTNVNIGNFGLTFGKELNAYEGNFETYENHTNTLNVKSYILENDSLFTFNDFNSISLESKNITEFSKNRFYFLDNSASDDSNKIDNLYFKSRDLWNSTNYNENLNNDNANIIAKIKKESSNDFNINKSRELVTYSNMLITKKSLNSNVLDSKLLENIDLHEVTTSNNSQNFDNFHIHQDEPKSFEIKSICRNNNYFSDYTDETEVKLKSNYYQNIITTPGAGASYALVNTTNNSGPNSNSKKINLLRTSTSFTLPSTTNTNVFIFDKLVFTTSSLISPTFWANVNYSLNDALAFKLSDSSSTRVYTIIDFVFKNPTTYNGQTPGTNQGYSNYDDWDSTRNSSHIVYLKDFIEYTTAIKSGAGYTYNRIKINLRFLDMWSNKTIVHEATGGFLNYGLLSPEGTKFKYTTSNKQKMLVTDGSWDSLTPSKQSRALSLIIYNAIVNKFYLTGSKASTNPFTSQNDFDIILNLLGNDPRVFIEEVDDNATKLIFNEGYNNTLSIVNASNIVGIEDGYNSDTSTDFITSDFQQKQTQVVSREDYYNSSYILEGRSRGTNNVDIETNRIINKKNISESIVSSYKTRSGKLIHEGSNKNKALKSNYLLKPDDKLVFGVSSNCNGQVMPTVFKLHDKLEIILIGRDYIDNHLEYKNNESKAIRKVVIGDNYVEKSGNTIYETKGSYFDNVWDKFSITDSIDDFKSGKNILSLNSSRKNGTYSGVITFSEENRIVKNKEIKVYNKDTVHPSLGNVFKNCLSLTELQNKNNKDEDEVKIIISENFSNTNNSLNVINKWHKTFHLDTFSSFFDPEPSNSNDSNISLNDKTLTSIQTKDLNVSVCYDTDSYKVNPSLREFYSYTKSNFDQYYSSISNPSQRSILLEKFTNTSKSIKDFVLPSSLLKSYQHGVQIYNEENYKTFKNGTQINSTFLNSNKIIQRETDTSKISKIYVDVNSSSLQYFDSFFNLMINTGQNEFKSSNTVNVHESLNRFSLHEYVNDIDENGNCFERYNPQWHLVIEMSFDSFNSLVPLVATSEGDNPGQYINKNLNMFLFENNSSDPVEKIAKAIRVDSSGELVTLAIPLYFWETLEINEPDYFEDSTNSKLKYGKISNKTHDSAFSSPTWYAKLQTTTSNSEVEIKRYTGIYKPFVNTSEVGNLEAYNTSANTWSHPTYNPIQKTYEDNMVSATVIDTTKIPFTLPYTINNLSNLTTSTSADVHDPDDAKSKLILNKSFYIASNKFKTLDDLSPVFNNKGQNIENLNNFYKLKDNKRYFTHIKYFENNEEQISLRKNNGLEISDINENLHLNEKIYRSKIYKKSTNEDFLPTNEYLIYKIHNMYTLPTSAQYDYNIIEVIGTDTEHVLFEKKSILSENLVLDLQETDIIRIYEDDLLAYNYFNKDFNNNTPYFEINLSSKSKDFDDTATLASSAAITITNANKILKANMKIDSTLDITNSLHLQKAGKLGSPIFIIERNKTKVYKNFLNQEEAITNFFYGFSKGKFRYPIEKLDGFKYGVQSGSPSTLKIHFSNKHFGMFFDKVMGTLSYATIMEDKSGKNLFEYNIEKRFVDSNFKFLASLSQSDARYTYNIDKRSRSTKPFIE